MIEATRREQFAEERGVALLQSKPRMRRYKQGARQRVARRNFGKPARIEKYMESSVVSILLKEWKNLPQPDVQAPEKPIILTVGVEHLQSLTSFNRKSDTSTEPSVLAPSSTMVERSGVSRTREQYLHRTLFNKDSLEFRSKYRALHRCLLPTHFRHEGCRRSSSRRTRAPE